jgi:Mn-dependent DtxR family transcriptional regulator
MKNITQGRTIRDSLERIVKLLEEKKEYMTISQISKSLNLNFQSVKKSIQTLENLELLKIITNGKTSLIKINQEKDKRQNEKFSRT